MEDLLISGGGANPSNFANAQRTQRIRDRVFRIYFFCMVGVPLISFLFGIIMFGSAPEHSEPDLTDDHIAQYDAEDPKLIEHIRKYYLYPPAKRSEPYKLLWPKKVDYSHKGQSIVADKIMNERRNGYFFEAGAYDGETYSNSLFFEKERNWTGLMVEPDLQNIQKVLDSKRKSTLIRGCLHGERKPVKMTFYGALETGTLNQYMNNARLTLTKFWRPVRKFQVWCWPLISVVKAADAPRKIDYMVLDIEGAEKPVLKGTDWSKIDVDVFQVEYMVFLGIAWDRDESRDSLVKMRHFFKDHLPDYREHSRVFLDLIFAKSSLL